MALAAEAGKMEKGGGGGGDLVGRVTGKFNELKTFFSEVKSELKKVTWPARKEVYATTIVVIATTVFFGFYLFALDMALSRVFEQLLRK